MNQDTAAAMSAGKTAPKKLLPNMIDSQIASEFELKGFCIIRNFLSDEEVEITYADYRSQGASDNQNYSIGLSSDAINRMLAPKISAACEVISAHTNTKTDIEGLHQAYYFDAQVLNFNAWHQDAESYYMLQNHSDYLNFYMPVHKPSPEKTNVQVIPADELLARAGQQAEKLSGLGGTICNQMDDGSTLVFGEAGEVMTLNFDIYELGYTPQLEAGDLLLMRGDTFHRTQDVDTPRVALSLRVSRADLQINRAKLASGTTWKTNLMANNWTEFGPLFNYFQDTGSSSIRWADARELIHESIKSGNNKVSAKQAKLQIYRQKLATGSFLSNFRRELNFRKTRKTLPNTV